MADSLAYTVPTDSFSPASLICEKGVDIHSFRGLSQMPINWNSTTNKICDPEEVCQETVLLVDAGVWAAPEGKTPARGPKPPYPGSRPTHSRPSFLFLRLGSSFWKRG